jgi:hypothetical protein
MEPLVPPLSPLAGFNFKYIARTGDALVRVLAVLGLVLLLVPTALAVLVAIFASSRQSYVYWLLDGLKGLLQVVVAPLPVHNEMEDGVPRSSAAEASAASRAHEVGDR